MASFPTLKSGQVTMLGFTRTRSHGTTVKEFEDGSEQRWKTRPLLARFSLQFTNIDGYDLSALRDFFISAKGRFDSTWDLTLESITYEHCSFDSDSFSLAEGRPNRFSGRLSVVQFIA